MVLCLLVVYSSVLHISTDTSNSLFVAGGTQISRHNIWHFTSEILLEDVPQPGIILSESSWPVPYYTLWPIKNRRRREGAWIGSTACVYIRFEDVITGPAASLIYSCTSGYLNARFAISPWGRFPLGLFSLKLHMVIRFAVKADFLLV